jgi:hypothetical protein
MRGLVTHDDGALEGCLALATDISDWRLSNMNSRIPATAPAPSRLRIVKRGRGQALSGTSLPIDQTKPSSSRATAAVATTVRFYRGVRRLYVLCG